MDLFEDVADFYRYCCGVADDYVVGSLFSVFGRRILVRFAACQVLKVCNSKHTVVVKPAKDDFCMTRKVSGSSVPSVASLPFPHNLLVTSSYSMV